MTRAGGGALHCEHEHADTNTANNPEGKDQTQSKSTVAALIILLDLVIFNIKFQHGLIFYNLSCLSNWTFPLPNSWSASREKGEFNTWLLKQKCEKSRAIDEWFARTHVDYMLPNVDSILSWLEQTMSIYIYIYLGKPFLPRHTTNKE